MKFILVKLTSPENTRVELRFESHSALMSHLMWMNAKEPGSVVIAVYISPL